MSIIDKGMDELISSLTISTEQYKETSESKPSIDVLDDYSLEYVFSFLRFEEKIRFERVCKRWQRLIFKDQKEIVISHWKNDQNCLNKLKNWNKYKDVPYINEKALESVVCKCPNITKVSIDIYFKGTALKIFGQYLTNLRFISMNIGAVEAKPFLEFGEMHGIHLESAQLFRFYNSQSKIEMAKQFLEYCKNLKSITFIGSEMPIIYICEEKDYLSCLEHVCGFDVHNTDMPLLKILSNKYRYKIKKFEVILTDLLDSFLKTAISYICQLRNLEVLHLCFNNINKSSFKRPIDELVAQISNHLTKLRKFNLKVESCYHFSETFIEVFSLFKSIENISINLFGQQMLFGSLQSFKDCHRLRYLSITCYLIDDKFFAISSQILSRLQIIEIEDNRQTLEFETQCSIESLSIMKSLESVVIRFGQRICRFYFGKKFEDY